MNKNRGFTMVELVVGSAIMIIAIMVAFNFVKGQTSNFSFGIMGTVETRCVDGYKFMIGNRSATQVLDEKGRAIPCVSN